MKKVIKLLNGTIDIFTIILMCALVVVVILQVFFRFVLSKPLTWSEEISRYLFMYITYFGGYICTRKGSHLGITLLQESLNPKAGKVVRIVSDFCINIYTGVVAYFGFVICSKVMSQLSPVTKIPIGIVYLCVPIGMLLMFCYSLGNTYFDITGKEVSN